MNDYKKVVSYQFQFELHPVIIVLEPATEVQVWGNIANITYKIFDEIKSHFQGLYFLGYMEKYKYSSNELQNKLPGHYAENKNRVFLIGPIYEQLKKSGFCGKIVAIGSQKPHDLMDWENTSILRNTIFLSVQNYPIDVNTLQGIKDRILDQNEMIKFSPGTIPIISINPISIEYNEQFEFSPHLGNESNNLLINLLQNDSPKIEVTKRMNSLKVIFEGKEQPSAGIEKFFNDLNENNKKILSSSILNNSFKCPHCGNMHSLKENIVCNPKNRIILDDIPADCLIIFSIEKGRYISLRNKGYFFPVFNENNEFYKLVSDEGEVYLYNDGKWVRNKKIKDLEEIGNGYWGLQHRI